MAGDFKIKLSVSFVFKLERLSSDFVFTFSKLLNINYLHTCEVFFHKGRKLRSRECAFRDNNTHSESGSNKRSPTFFGYVVAKGFSSQVDKIVASAIPKKNCTGIILFCLTLGLAVHWCSYYTLESMTCHCLNVNAWHKR